MAKRTSQKASTKRRWFSSTVLVFLVGFAILFVAAVLRYGAREAFDTMLKYALGMSATALFFAFLAFLFRKPIKRVLKNI